MRRKRREKEVRVRKFETFSSPLSQVYVFESSYTQNSYRMFNWNSCFLPFLSFFSPLPHFSSFSLSSFLILLHSFPSSFVWFLFVMEWLCSRIPPPLGIIEKGNWSGRKKYKEMRRKKMVVHEVGTQGILLFLISSKVRSETFPSPFYSEKVSKKLTNMICKRVIRWSIGILLTIIIPESRFSCYEMTVRRLGKVLEYGIKIEREREEWKSEKKKEWEEEKMKE